MKRTYRPVLGFLLTVMMGIGLLMGCGEEETEPQTLQVDIDLKFQQLPSGARIISGTFVNTTDQPIESGYIQVGLYDANNVRVHTIDIPIQNVPPGGEEVFRRPLDTDLDIRRASVKRFALI